MSYWNRIYESSETEVIDKGIIINKFNMMRRERPLTNIYSLENIKCATKLWMEDQGFLFTFDDHGISRLCFCVKDLKSLCSLLMQVKSGVHYLEYLTKDGIMRIEGLELVARLRRLVNADCRTVFADAILLKYQDDSIEELAQSLDAKEINRILWSIFHTEISHLLWDNEIAERIEKGQISIHRADRIDAILMVDVWPKRFYINQVVNMGDRKNIHAMLLKRLRNYVDDGGRYLYSWVETDNIASMKFHGKYGMEHDGTWNLIWRLER